jgi:acetyl esterase/lipase
MAHDMERERGMTDVSRRGLIGMGSALALAPTLARAAAATDPLETVPLWPGKVPGDIGTVIKTRIKENSSDPAHPDRWSYGTSRPDLTVCRPAQPNGAGILVIPGGSYEFHAFDNEGLEQARWLNALGVTAFVLNYRLPAEGWGGRAEVPLQDAQRAIRVIRRDAARFGIDPQRVAALGFSAGGHLCGSLATRHAEPVYAPVDSADALSARPTVAGLIYPVVTLVGSTAHGGSRDNLLGVDAPAAARERRSVERRVDADTPPLFLIHASDDGVVPVANSISLYQAMLDHKRPAEMHLFDEGGHGFGARLPQTMPASIWPRLFTRFAARKGVFPASAA